MDPIYVTGHRNPDTDSIVSAMAYAALRNALGDREYRAARLGHVSDETQLVLDRFGFPAPIWIKTMRTQVRDLDYDTPPALSSGVTISRAWAALSTDTSIAALPITNEDGTLFGMLSSGDIAASDMQSIEHPHIDAVPLFNVLSVLEGRILNEAGDLVDSISGDVCIALPQSCDNLLFSGSGSIIVCGHQPDMVRRAIEQHARCVIVCQAEVDQELLEQKTDTCVISTPFDAYQVVRLICHAMPVSHVCKNHDLVYFHLNDYIDDVQNRVLESRFRAYPILDENERVVGMLSRFHLLRPRRKRVVLMDHNERAQSVAGLEQAEILEIVDHHRLADIETKTPIYVRNEPVGSTATIVAGMYQEKGLMPFAKMAGLMAAAIVSDTVMFKSPTCTQRDIDLANRMARIANVSLDELGKAIFSAGCGDDKTVEAMLNTDYKEFHIAGHNLAVSQITCMDSDRLLKRRDEFLQAMQAIRQKQKMDTVLLMITDVLLDGTQLLYVGDENTIRQAFDIHSEEENCAFLPKIKRNGSRNRRSVSGAFPYKINSRERLPGVSFAVSQHIDTILDFTSKTLAQ